MGNEMNRTWFLLAAALAAGALSVGRSSSAPSPLLSRQVTIPAPRKQQTETGRRRPDPRPPHPAGDRTKKAVKPRTRCTLAEWAQTTYRLSQRRAARLIPVRIGTLRYQSVRDHQ